MATCFGSFAGIICDLKSVIGKNEFSNLFFIKTVDKDNKRNFTPLLSFSLPLILG
jgi:hypothetical protein